MARKCNPCRLTQRTMLSQKNKATPALRSSSQMLAHFKMETKRGGLGPEAQSINHCRCTTGAAFTSCAPTCKATQTSPSQCQLQTTVSGKRKSCQEWDSNPRLQWRLRPERSALDRSAILTASALFCKSFRRKNLKLGKTFQENKVSLHFRHQARVNRAPCCCSTIGSTRIHAAQL